MSHTVHLTPAARRSTGFSPLAQAVVDLQDRIGQAHNEIAGWMKTVRTLNECNDRQAKTIREHDEDVEILNATIEKQKQRIALLDGLHVNQARTIEEQHRLIGRLQHDVNLGDNAERDLRSRIESLTQECDAVTDDFNALGREYDDLSKRMDAIHGLSGACDL